MNKKLLLFFIVLGIIATYVALVGTLRWGDRTPPRINLTESFSLVGPATRLSIHIEDEETGLQEISVRLIQNLEEYILAEEYFSSDSILSLKDDKQHSFDLELIPYGDNTIPKRRGPATLVIYARDYSWRSFLEGNLTMFQQNFTVKFTPPRLEILSPPLPISQGGTGIIFYRVSDDAKTYGVKIGEYFFRGFPTPNENYSNFSLFAFPHDLPASTPVQLVANDGLGNKGVEKVDIKITPKKWRRQRIRITDQFIERTILPIIANTPELKEEHEPLANFLQVNNVLRALNSQQLKVLSTASQPDYLWRGAFVQLSRSQVKATFADHREYIYQGKVIDKQVHLGFDLAVTKQYPVEAANDGIVILSDYLGIYGNTIVIDHGYGLQSLYAHLSSFKVKKGDYIRKKQIIARSGSTGLAAGDHLHFSLLLHGIQINPLEWWDPQWVKTRISNRLGKNRPIGKEKTLSGGLLPMNPSYRPNPLTEREVLNDMSDGQPKNYGPPSPQPPPPTSNF